MTKDRLGAGLIVVAAVIGLVLVLGGPSAESDDDDGPSEAPSTGQVAPAPGGQVSPPASPGGQGQPAAPAQPQPGQPAQGDGDDDGDGDGDGDGD